MRIRKEAVLLLLFFVLAFSLRLFFVLQTEEFSSDEAYYTLRQIEHVRETGVPIKYDGLSYGGREQISLPGYYYVLSFFTAFMPDKLVLKIIPNLFAALLVFIVYGIALEIAKNREAAFIAAFVSAFIPIFIQETSNHGSVYALAVPLAFLVVYALIKMQQRPAYVSTFVIAFLLAIVVDTSIFIIIAGMFIYLLLVYLLRRKPRRAEVEITLFSAFLFLWISFLFFKKAMLFYGPSFATYALPRAVLASTGTILFPEQAIPLIEWWYALGFLPLLVALYVFYDKLKLERDKNLILLFSIMISALALMAAGIVTLHVGLTFIGVAAAMLTAPGYVLFCSYMEQTNVSFLRKPVMAAALLLFLLTSGLLSMNALAQSVIASPSPGKVQALTWLQRSAEAESTIATDIEEGHMAAYYSKKKTVADSNIMLAPQPLERINDLDELFRLPYKVNALTIMDKYDAQYLFLSSESKKKYNITAPRFIVKGDTCFSKVYQLADITIYRRQCNVDE